MAVGARLGGEDQQRLRLVGIVEVLAVQVDAPDLRMHEPLGLAPPGNAYVGPDGFGSIKGHPTVRTPGQAGLDETAAAELWAATAALTGVGQ